MNSYKVDLDVLIEKMSEYCSFSLGKKLLLDTVVSFDRLIIKRDNARIKEALDLTYKYGSMPFSGIKDISDALENANKGIMLRPVDFMNIVDSINCVIGIDNYMHSFSDDVSNIRELSDTLVVCRGLKKHLESCFNSYGEVVDSASKTLYNLRKELIANDASLMSTANNFISKNSNNVIDNIVTTRNNRICVLMKVSNKNSYGGFIHGESASGMAAYVEPVELMHLNNKKLQLLDEIDEEIERILKECSALVKDNYYDLKNNIDTISILDMIFAKAIWGKENDACVADLSDNKIISITKGFHPLIDRKKVVKNSYHIDENHNMLLITGPNTGGKTVTLKVIALSVLMTYCGMPICADEATIPYFDNVFIDIGDMQSVVQSLSTFSAHLSNLAKICDSATDHSLVLIDEIGSGTDPKEGESLAIAIFNYLRKLKVFCVATTHYNRLKQYGKRHDDVLVASVLFDEKTLSPTYKYVEGLTGQSNALTIAKKYGLKKEIVNEAYALVKQSKSNEEVLIEKLEIQISENENLKNELNDKINQYQILNQELAKKQKQLEANYEKYLDKAKIEADEYVNNIKNQADEILKQALNSPDIKYHEVLKKTKKLEELKSEENKEELDDDFKVNDLVEIRQTGQIAKIIDLKNNNVTLDLNGIKVKSNISKIKKTNRQIVKTKAKKVKTSDMVIRSMPMECNIIGLRKDEAMSVLAKYIDDAKVHGLKQVRIIHGDGTGALRKATFELLSKDKDVKEYHTASYSEGSTGATIVIFHGA